MFVLEQLRTYTGGDGSGKVMDTKIISTQNRSLIGSLQNVIRFTEGRKILI